MLSPLASAAMADAETGKSDLPTRAASAAVMIAIAGLALRLGGMVWALFVAAVATGVYWEWSGLVRGFATSRAQRRQWMIAGFVYIAVAAGSLLGLRMGANGIATTLLVVTMVIAIDVGAYFSGRTFGGPKIAPSISPSKTWAGLIGGMLGATIVLAAYAAARSCPPYAAGRCGTGSVLQDLWLAVLGGALAAGVAQAGDFFESWMKRRAGVKDSGKLIPGHGGLFDRVDGLLAINFLIGLFALAVLCGRLSSGASLLPGPA